MINKTTTVGDLRAKINIIKSYFGITPFHIWIFLSLRTFLIPLKKFHEVLPKNGKIIEIGSGHGILCQYLAQRSPKRRIIGYDLDHRRINIAKKSIKNLKNIIFISREFQVSKDVKYDGILIVGVFCLLEDKSVINIVNQAANSLRIDGTLLIHDILDEEDKSVIQKFHLFRENLLSKMGFTKGEGLFLRDKKWWRNLLVKNNFNKFSYIKAPVFLHSTFNLLCRLKS